MPTAARTLPPAVERKANTARLATTLMTEPEGNNNSLTANFALAIFTYVPARSKTARWEASVAAAAGTPQVSRTVVLNSGLQCDAVGGTDRCACGACCAAVHAVYCAAVVGRVGSLLRRGCMPHGIDAVHQQVSDYPAGLLFSSLFFFPPSLHLICATLSAPCCSDATSTKSKGSTERRACLKRG